MDLIKLGDFVTAYGRTNSITFYDAPKKRLLSFDASIVGFKRICKMAKRSSILDFKK